MLRYFTVAVAGILLAAGLLAAGPAQARRVTRVVQYRSRRPATVRVYTQRAYSAPYGRAYGYRARRADRNRDGIPDYMERSPGVYQQRVAGWRRSYRDSDRDGVPDYRDRYPHNRRRH